MTRADLTRALAAQERSYTDGPEGVDLAGEGCDHCGYALCQCDDSDADADVPLVDDCDDCDDWDGAA
jgi:hypothetical protein